MILDDPGPLESRELLCKHAMKTEKICQKSTTDNIFGWHDIAYEITTSQLNALNKRFGNPLTVAKTTLEHDNVGEGKVAPNENCEECEKEKLLRRKKRERNKIISLEKAFKLSKESVTYVVSESWMRAWRCFVNDETNLVPGPIFNEHLLGTDKKMNLDLKIEKDYRVLSKEVWDYLLEIYGGGPEIVNDFISDKDLVK
ncbi:Ubiquitin carboxyl-terminal hydrolase 20 [Bonamia ostreae]|uniref:Ubiquitin carboxyl-terminal hydrolase 20 n=1 Tax=Bonamia ostreae TaxID=126728 RepID=A0ABV2AT52_9EUKA